MMGDELTSENKAALPQGLGPGLVNTFTQAGCEEQLVHPSLYCKTLQNGASHTSEQRSLSLNQLFQIVSHVGFLRSPTRHLVWLQHPQLQRQALSTLVRTPVNSTAAPPVRPGGERQLLPACPSLRCGSSDTPGEPPPPPTVGPPARRPRLETNR